MGLDLILTARLDTEKAVNQNEIVCGSADTGLRTGSVMDTNQSPVGAALGGDSHKPRAHPANSQPVSPTTGLCSLIADQPDTLSSSCGLRCQACQESRSRVFYGWLASLVSLKSTGLYANMRGLAIGQPPTKAPCDLYVRAFDDRGAWIENRFMDSVGDLSGCQDRRPMRTVTGVQASDDGLKRGQGVLKVLTLLTQIETGETNE